jgi:acyl-CoA synthetase (AMP-forming)/AMP-acid ligase II
VLTSTSARLVLGNLAAWSHGSAIVYPSEIYDPRAIVDAVVKERCTALHGVPTHFLGILEEVHRRQQAGEELDFSRLRFISSCCSGTAFPDHCLQDRNCRRFARPNKAYEATDSQAEPTRNDDCVWNEYVLGLFLPLIKISTFLVISLTAETSPVSFQTTPVDSITQRVETVGKVLPHVMAKVVDDDGNVVPVETPGELLVSGYLVQKGYELQSTGLFAD